MKYEEFFRYLKVIWRSFFRYFKVRGVFLVRGGFLDTLKVFDRLNRSRTEWHQWTSFKSCKRFSSFRKTKSYVEWTAFVLEWCTCWSFAMLHSWTTFILFMIFLMVHTANQIFCWWHSFIFYCVQYKWRRNHIFSEENRYISPYFKFPENTSG